MRVGLEPELLSVWLGGISGVAVLALTLLFSRRLSGRWGWEVWIAPACLAANPGFCAWATGGLETMFFACLVLAGFLAFAAESEHGGTSRWGSSLWLSAATLARPDGILFAVVAGFAAVFDVLRGRRSPVSLARWSAPYIVIVGGHALWRRSYYGEWLPNTFYAKVPAAWWDRGLIFLNVLNDQYWIAWLLPLIGFGLLRKPRLAPSMLAGALALYTLYVAYVGGDIFGVRFLVHVMPMLYLSAAYGVMVWRERPLIPGNAPALGLRLPWPDSCCLRACGR